MVKRLWEWFLWGIDKVFRFGAFLLKLCLLAFAYALLYQVLKYIDSGKLNLFIAQTITDIKGFSTWFLYLPSLSLLLSAGLNFFRYIWKILKTLDLRRISFLENWLLIVVTPFITFNYYQELFYIQDKINLKLYLITLSALLLRIHIAKTCPNTNINILEDTGKSKNKKDVRLIDRDTPIDDINECIGSRAHFVKDLADLFNAQSKECIIYGLQGKWGEGKTSMLQILEKVLKDDFIFMFFSPNEYHSEEAIIYGFYHQLESKLKEFFIVDSAFENILHDYVKQLVCKNSNSLISAFSGFLGDGETPDILKNKINTRIAKLNKQLIVVVDDFDRLSEEEVQAVFKIVRNNSDFYNTKYIICYDPVTILNVLKNTNFPADFLDKLVQVPIAMPKAKAIDIKDYMIKKISEKDAPIKEMQDEHFRLVGTLRNANRIIAMIKSFYFPMKTEINFQDFFMLSILKTLNEKVYEDIYLNRFKYYNPCQQTNKQESIGELKKQLLALLDEGEKENQNIDMCCDVIFELFGRVDAKNARGRRSQLFCNKRYFDRYFYFQREIYSDGEIENLINGCDYEKHEDVSNAINVLLAKNATKEDFDNLKDEEKKDFEFIVFVAEKEKQNYSALIDALRNNTYRVKEQKIFIEGLILFVGKKGFLNSDNNTKSNNNTQNAEIDLFHSLFNKDLTQINLYLDELVKKIETSDFVYFVDFVKRAYHVKGRWQEIEKTFLRKVSDTFLVQHKNIFEGILEQNHFNKVMSLWINLNDKYDYHSRQNVEDFNNYMTQKIFNNEANKNIFHSMLDEELGGDSNKVFKFSKLLDMDKYTGGKKIRADEKEIFMKTLYDYKIDCLHKVRQAIKNDIDLLITLNLEQELAIIRGAIETEFPGKDFSNYFNELSVESQAIGYLSELDAFIDRAKDKARNKCEEEFESIEMHLEHIYEAAEEDSARVSQDIEDNLQEILNVKKSNHLSSDEKIEAFESVLLDRQGVFDEKDFEQLFGKLDDIKEYKYKS